MAKKLPKIIVKSMWEHIHSGASDESMRDWFVSEGMNIEHANEAVVQLKACASEEALYELVNAGREEEDSGEGDLSDEALEAVAGGARAAAGRSKWPWEKTAQQSKPRRK